MQLNTAMMACASAAEVLDLITPRLEGDANAANVATALMRIAALPGADEAKHDARLRQLFAVSFGHLAGMHRRGLSCTLRVASRLELQPSEEWMERYWQVTFPILYQYEPQTLAVTLHAAARLSRKPPQAWMELYWRRVAETLPYFRVLSLTPMLHACGCLNIHPPADLLARFWEHSGALMPQYDARGLTTTLHAAGELRSAPPVAWMEQFWQATNALDAQGDPREFSDILNDVSFLHRSRPPIEWLQRGWELSRPSSPAFSTPLLMKTIVSAGFMGLAPPDDWVREFWARVEDTFLPTLDAVTFSNATHKRPLAVLNACAKLHIAPPEKLMRRFWPASEALLHKYDATNLHAVLGAAGYLTDDPPPRSWLARFFEVSGPRLEEIKPHNLAKVIRSCSCLEVTPPEDWMQRYWHASARALPELSTENATIILHALLKLDLTPPEEWMQRFWEGSAQRIAVSRSPSDIAFLVYAAAKGVVKPELKPSESWTLQCWAASRDKLAALDAKDLAVVMWSASKLLPIPDAEWLSAYFNASAAKLPAFNAQGFAIVMFAAGRLHARLPPKWLQAFWRESIHALPECKPQELANMLEGLALLNAVPPLPWLSCFWQAATAASGQANVWDLLGSLESSAALKVRPTDEYLDRFWPCSEPMLCNMELSELVTLLRGCVTLACKPPDAWMEQCMLACAVKLPDLPMRNAAELVFSCCALEMWHQPHLPALWEHLLDTLQACDGVYDSYDGPDSARALRLMHQTYQAAAVERPGLLAAPSPALMDAARTIWLRHVQQPEEATSANAFLLQHLTRLGVEFTPSHFCERSGRAVNIALTNSVGQPTALEVTTPASLLHDGRPQGVLALRRRVLAAYGWHVVEFSMVRWKRLKSDEERELYLRNLLGLSPNDDRTT